MSDLVLSPSQINLFRYDRALWCLQHYKGKRGKGAVAMELGTAVHSAAQAIVKDILTPSEAITRATMSFDTNVEDLGESGEEQRVQIPLMVDQAVPLISSLRPEKPVTEEHVQITLQGGTILRGFIDFSWDDLCVDLKTGRNCYNAIQPDHLVQLACYWFMTGKQQAIAYVTKAKSNLIYADEDGLADTMAWTMKTIHAMEDLVAMGEEKALRLCPPTNVFDYRWDEETRNMAKEIWT